MNRIALFGSMINRIAIDVNGINKDGRKVTVRGMVNSMQIEDGSGYSFNVVVSNLKGNHTLYVRCLRFNVAKV